MGIFDFWRKKRNQVFDQTIDLSPPGIERNASYANTDFQNCTFIHSETWPHSFHDCTFINCHFTFRKSGHNHSSPNCKFTKCKFKFIKAHQFRFNSGQHFMDCHFSGQLNDSVFAVDPEGEYSTGGVYDCSFVNLKFDLIDFRGHDKSKNLQFATWPIVILHVGEHIQKYDKSYFPISLKYYNFGYATKSRGFMVMNLNKFSDDPEVIWAAIHDAPFLVFPGKDSKPKPIQKRCETVRQRNKKHNAVHDKYRELLLYMMARQCSIHTITREQSDVSLHLKGKSFDDHASAISLDVTLKNCSRIEFVGGTQSGDAVGYDKKFFIRGFNIQEDNDVVILKGPRKTMGCLHLTFSQAEIVKHTSNNSNL